MVEQGIHLGPIELNLEIAAIEKELILVLGKYTSILEEAAREYSPSTIAQYMYDLAKLFNRFYYELSILGEENTEIKNCRLNLAVQTRKTIDHGCSLLGITAPTRM
jgi:arginyl-tRNA synthetase